MPKTTINEADAVRQECADLAALIVRHCTDASKAKLALLHLMVEHCGGADNCVSFVPSWFFTDSECWDQLSLQRLAAADMRPYTAEMAKEREKLSEHLAGFVSEASRRCPRAPNPAIPPHSPLHRSPHNFTAPPDATAGVRGVLIPFRSGDC